MNNKLMGKTGEKVSILGFGMMRLPVDSEGVILKKDAIQIVRSGIDQGINYIDTAWPYHKGNSEAFTGEALKDGYREKVYLATKLPSWLIKSSDDFEYYLEEQLKRLQTDHIDFYLVHAINRDFWNEKLLPNHLFEFLDKIKSDGRVLYVGFSFHDNIELFKEVVDSYEWDFCQIQLNYLDQEYQAGLEGMKYAGDKGLGVIVMEPLRGGSLASGIPEDIQEIWNSGDDVRSPVEWALKYVWSQPEVTMLLSGMSTQTQVDENVEFATKSDVFELSVESHERIMKVRAAYRERIQVNCTSCEYCMPCPNGVDIPACFKTFNDANIFRKPEAFRKRYHQFIQEKERASQCIECGVCMDKCPQKIDIINELKRVANEMEK